MLHKSLQFSYLHIQKVLKQRKPACLFLCISVCMFECLIVCLFACRSFTSHLCAELIGASNERCCHPLHYSVSKCLWPSYVGAMETSLNLIQPHISHMQVPYMEKTSYLCDLLLKSRKYMQSTKELQVLHHPFFSFKTSTSM